MMRVEDYLQDAIKQKATELLLCSSQKPKARVAANWTVLEKSEVRPNELREQIFQILDEEQRMALIEDKSIQLVTEILNKKCDLQISIAGNGFNLHARWCNDIERLADFAIPQSVIEVFRRGEGISLITGSRSCGKSTLAAQLIEKVTEAGVTTTAMIQDQLPEDSLPDTVVFQTEQFIKNMNVVRGFDFIVIDSSLVSAWRQAVQLAEIGARVLLILPYSDIQTALARLSEKLESQPALGLNRIVHSLQITLSLKMAPAFDQKLQPVFELLFATQDIKNAILNNNWKIVDEYVRTQGEKTGMRTMNQSILSLMLKRKIDLKSGFAASPAPEELDRMLEKVGF